MSFPGKETPGGGKNLGRVLKHQGREKHLFTPQGPPWFFSLKNPSAQPVGKPGLRPFKTPGGFPVIFGGMKWANWAPPEMETKGEKNLRTVQRS